MSDAVAVPLWLVLLAGLLAAWAFYEHVLMPALRWLVTHPANQVIDQMSTRLRIGIRPFQRTRRQALIHRLLTDPKVQDAAAQFSAEHKVPHQCRVSKNRNLCPRDRARVQRLPLFPHRLLARPARGAAALPRAHRLRRFRRAGAHRPGRHRGVRDEPPLEHGLCARRLSRRRPGRAVLRGRRVGADLAAVGADPRDGRLLRAPQFARRALPPGAGALHRDGDRSRRAAGGVSRKAA